MRDRNEFNMVWQGWSATASGVGMAVQRRREIPKVPVLPHFGKRDLLSRLCADATGFRRAAFILLAMSALMAAFIVRRLLF